MDNPDEPIQRYVDFLIRRVQFKSIFFRNAQASVHMLNRHEKRAGNNSNSKYLECMISGASNQIQQSKCILFHFQLVQITHLIQKTYSGVQLELPFQ